jgi:hypothetical protein
MIVPGCMSFHDVRGFASLSVWCAALKYVCINDNNVINIKHLPKLLYIYIYYGCLRGFYYILTNTCTI